MSTAKTVLATVGAGAAAYLGYRWYRTYQGERLYSRMTEEFVLRTAANSVPPDGDAYWEQMRTPASSQYAPRDPGDGLTRYFDPLFAAHAGTIPVAYLRALANAESGLRANDPKGLINVLPVAVEDYNRRHGTALVPSDMRIPDTNVRVATDILRTIIASYQKNHPTVPNLREDWKNPRFVELLTLGWNAGHSESSGVGKVVAYIKGRGQTAITVDDVHKMAPSAGASRWLWEPPTAAAKLAWSKGVARRYFAEKERDADAERRVAAAGGSASGKVG